MRERYFHVERRSLFDPRLLVTVRNRGVKPVVAYQFALGALDGKRKITRENYRTAHAFVALQVLGPYMDRTDDIPFSGPDGMRPELAIRPTLVEFSDGTGCYLPEASKAASSLAVIRQSTERIVKAYVDAPKLYEQMKRNPDAQREDAGILHELDLFLNGRPDAAAELKRAHNIP